MSKTLLPPSTDFIWLGHGDTNMADFLDYKGIFPFFIVWLVLRLVCDQGVNASYSRGGGGCSRLMTTSGMCYSCTTKKT